MASKLKQPSEYAEQVAYRNAQPHNAGRKPLSVRDLRLERITNRHRETCGQPWGWYEVFPLGITVGYWGSDKDDLRGVDISAWNRSALCAESPELPKEPSEDQGRTL